MKKQVTLLIVMLLSIVAVPGCMWKKRSCYPCEQQCERVCENECAPECDDEGIFFYEDEHSQKFARTDDHVIPAEEFAWAEEVAAQGHVVRFDYDKATLRQDQKDAFTRAVADAKAAIEAYELDPFSNEKPCILIEGHSCKDGIAGEAYKLALSNKRADALRNEFITAGIPAEYIKLSGRGTQFPAVVDGKACVDKDQQHLNRRAEVRVIYA